MTDENSITLGGNIELSGFSNLDGGQIIVLKKIIGNYVNRIGTITSNFEKLNMTMKSVHGNQFELHAKVLDNGKPITASLTDRNLFVGIDSVLKKIINEVKR